MVVGLEFGVFLVRVPAGLTQTPDCSCPVSSAPGLGCSKAVKTGTIR